MRVCFIVSYDGSKFDGFQQQPNKNTVLGSFIKVCEKLSIEEKPVGSGRTDKNVHANNQVIHLDIPSFWEDMAKLKEVFNRHLHPFIHVKRVFEVQKEFHARFSAKKRAYRYIISHKNFSPFYASYVLFHPILDTQKLKKHLKIFEGKHNFEFFKKNGSDTKSSIRTIFSTNVYMYKNHTIITLVGDGFLRSQVRMIVDTLLKANQGKLTTKQIKEQLQRQKRHSLTLAPPNGLYLHRVFYEISS